MKTISAHGGDGISTKKLVPDPFFKLDLPLLVKCFPDLQIAVVPLSYNLGGKKNGGFLKQILSTSIQEKLIKIGDG